MPIYLGPVELPSKYTSNIVPKYVREYKLAGWLKWLHVLNQCSKMCDKSAHSIFCFAGKAKFLFSFAPVFV